MSRKENNNEKKVQRSDIVGETPEHQLKEEKQGRKLIEERERRLHFERRRKSVAIRKEWNYT